MLNIYIEDQVSKQVCIVVVDAVIHKHEVSIMRGEALGVD